MRIVLTFSMSLFIVVVEGVSCEIVGKRGENLSIDYPPEEYYYWEVKVMELEWSGVGSEGI